MDGGLRRSTRQLKLKKDDVFEYDDEVLEALIGRKNTLDNSWQRCNSTTSESSDKVSKVQCFSGNSVIDCPELEIIPLVHNHIENPEISLEAIILQCENSETSNNIQKECAVSLGHTASRRASSECKQISAGERTQQRNSSTNYNILDFEDIEGNFLSASSLTDMSDSENEPNGTGGNPDESEFGATGLGTGAKGEVELTEKSLASAVMAALNKMDKVADKVDSLEQLVRRQNKRI